jgi:hypothetical protein
MRPTSKNAALACALTLGGLVAPGYLGRAGAQDEAKPARSARGGALAKTARHQFEVFFYTTGLRVFPMDAAGSPLVASRMTGTATFYHPNSPRPWFTRPLRGATAVPGQALGSLDLVIGLGKVPPSGARVAFEVAGLADPSEPAATFTVPVEFATAPAGSAAGHPAAPAAAPSPSYVYGPGYYGYGYYGYPGPESAPAQEGSRTVYAYPSRTSSSGAGFEASHRDWSTGRDNLPLSKPWLRPMD